MDRLSYEQLQQQLDESRELIRALRQGEVDAIVSERELALVRLRATEEALRKLTMELEERVRERTAELEQSNLRLQSALAELRSAQVRVAALAAAVAHEVNNPLMGVLNAVGYVRRHETRPELREALKDADEGLRVISDITRNLLTFSHSRAAPPAEADIGAVIDRTLNFLRADLEARGIKLVRRVPRGLPLVVGGEVRLQQVLSNLVVNARDALEESAAKEIEVRARVEHGAMRVDVIDSGPGIPQSLQQKIFEPFFTTKPGRGTGLGLPVSKGIMADLGGELAVHSEPGKGARFTMRLPLVQAHGEEGAT